MVHNGNPPKQESIISDTKSYHIKDDESPTQTPAPPSTPRKVKVPINTQNAMTVAVTQSQITLSSGKSSATNTSVVTVKMGRPTSPPENSSSSDTDIQHHSSSTALRRLYFKTARNARSTKCSSSSVPKVVVMGSSTTSTSEATINTSTESASTLVTNVTATDTSETCDSLDLGETSGQSEPLLSSLDEPPPPTAIPINSTQIAHHQHQHQHQHHKTKNEQEPQHLFSHEDTPMSINYKANENSNSNSNGTIYPTPRTAPVSSTVHFPFDVPSSPKSVRITDRNHSPFNFVDASSVPADKQVILSEMQTHPPYLYQQHPHYHPPLSGLPQPLAQQNQIKDLNKDNEKENKKRKDNQSKFISRENLNHLKQANDAVNLGLNDFDDNKKQKKDATTLKSRNRFINSIKSLANKDRYGSNSKLHSAPAVAFRKASTSYDSYDSYESMTDSTMFPFDREAIDYKRIQQECFTDEDDTHFPFNFDTDTSNYDTDSPEYEKPCFDSPSKSYKNLKFEKNNEFFQSYSSASPHNEESFQMYERRRFKRTKADLMQNKKYHTNQCSDAFEPKLMDCSSKCNDNYTVSKFEQIASKFNKIPPKSSDAFHNSSITSTSFYQDPPDHHQTTSIVATVHIAQNTSDSVLRTTPTALPNLRIDFFAESKFADDTTIIGGLDKCQKQTHAAGSNATAPTTSSIIAGEAAGIGVGAINVTSNPMDAAVCTQPRATIVVQQASLSLDNTVETFLLKNESDFVSVEQGKEQPSSSVSLSTKKQREENMRQLLDVTNTLTSEEIRDFEMRYGSPHHCRSQSVKTPGSRASGRPNQLCLPQQRSRVASMPNTGVEEEYYRLRHFSITGKGVVNRGDSVKSKRSRSNNSVASSNSSTEHLTATNVANSARTSATCSLASSRESSTSNPGNGPYRVLMLGGPAVGKSSLVSQFMTSEYLHAYDTSLDDDTGEKSISVLLSGEESELIFIDHSSAEMSPENCLSSYDPHGYCVIYSSADQESFMVAERVIQQLWTSENIAQRAVILVGNKADLARSRVISSEEGKAMATAYDCKFIETSVGINHNVDELLVGLLTQIRLKLENPEKSRDLFRKRSCRKSKRRACSPLGSACLSGNGGTNPSSPVSVGPINIGSHDLQTPPSSVHSSPRKYRGSRTSASLKVKGLLGRVWARDSKSKSCENLHVL